MIRFTRTRRSEYFSGMTPWWIISFVLFVSGILLVFWWNRTQGANYTVCPLKLAFGIPCPLCGGTTASLFWIEGKPVSAFSSNPLVALALPLFALFSIFWVGFGIRIGTTLPTPIVTALMVLLLILNWAYNLGRD